MSEKYILFSTTNGKEPKMWEHGAQARLKTYMDGMVRGLLMAGYKEHVGFRGVRVLKKDDITIEISMMTLTEWKEL